MVPALTYLFPTQLPEKNQKAESHNNSNNEMLLEKKKGQSAIKPNDRTPKKKINVRLVKPAYELQANSYRVTVLSPETTAREHEENSDTRLDERERRNRAEP